MPCPCRNKRRIGPILRLLIALALFASAPLQANGNLETVLLRLTVNGTPKGTAFVLRDEDGRYFADTGALKSWGLRKPFPKGAEMHGRTFHPFSDIPGISVNYDSAQMTLDVTLPPAHMNGQTRVVYQDTVPTPTAGVGGYLDYDANYTDDGAADTQLFSTLINPTVFSGLGSARSGFLFRNSSFSNDDDEDTSTVEDGWIRLETTFTRDDPERLLSYRLGDTTTPSTVLGRSLRFGGIQVGTNFATRPGFVTFPLPSVSGSAAVPSTLDIFVNGSLRGTQEVEAGNFSIEEIPVITGAGEVQIVARDLLGREQVISENFYSSNELLRPGLNDYSVGAGFLRRDFGNESNEYDDPFFSASLRRGVTDRLTPSARIDATDEVVTAGAGAAWRMKRGGVFQAASAYSADQDDTGVLWQLGQRFQSPRYRFAWRLQGATEDFTQPGVDVDTAFPKLQSLMSTGLSFGPLGSVGASLIRETFHDDQDDRDIFTLTWSRSFLGNLSMRASASYVSQDDSDLTASLLFSRPFGRRHSGSMFMQAGDGDSYVRANYQRNLPFGPGYGYRVSTLAGDRDGAEVEGLLNTNVSRLSAELRQNDGDTGWRANASGALAWMDGHLAATRDIRDAFAVVDVGDYENVRVYYENREMGRTNRQGQLLIPGLRPYEHNRIRIEGRDLPLSARFDSLSAEVAPYYRTGVAVEFEATASRAAVMRVLRMDGTPVPEGARAQLDGRSDWHPVGQEGFVYVEGLDRHRRLTIDWGDGACRVRESLAAPSANVPFADLGELICVDVVQ